MVWSQKFRLTPVLRPDPARCCQDNKARKVTVYLTTPCFSLPVVSSKQGRTFSPPNINNSRVSIAINNTCSKPTSTGITHNQLNRAILLFLPTVITQNNLSVMFTVLTAWLYMHINSVNNSHYAVALVIYDFSVNVSSSSHLLFTANPRHI